MNVTVTWHAQTLTAILRLLLLLLSPITAATLALLGLGDALVASVTVATVARFLQVLPFLTNEALVFACSDAFLGQGLDGLLGIIRSESTKPLLHFFVHLMLNLRAAGSIVRMVERL